MVTHFSTVDTDPDRSVLAKVGVKLSHPTKYSGGSDPEEFEVFVTGLLWWLSMNSLLGPSSSVMQLGYLETHLKGEAMEWFYRNA